MKNMFGAPNTGVHSLRLFNVAVVDLLATVVVAYIITVYTKYPLYYTLSGLLILALAVHKIFGVESTFNKVLGF
jgi:hypothetical protein